MNDEAVTGRNEASNPRWNPEVARNFFKEWYRKQFENGIISIYLQDARRFSEGFLRPELPDEAATGQAIREASMTEQPLGVIKETDVLNEAGEVIAEELQLVKVQPMSGQALPDTHCWVANVHPDGTFGERNEAFSIEQALLLVYQYNQQQQLGLVISEPI